MSKEGYVYVISDGAQYKIGMSVNDPQSRLKQLQTGTAHQLNLVAQCRYPDCASAEKMWHNKYKNKRIRGEWFALSDSDVKVIQQEMLPTSDPYAKVGNYTYGVSPEGRAMALKERMETESKIDTKEYRTYSNGRLVFDIDNKPISNQCLRDEKAIYGTFEEDRAREKNVRIKIESKIDTKGYKTYSNGKLIFDKNNKPIKI